MNDCLKQAARQALEWFECLGDVEPYTLPDFVPVEGALRAALSHPEPEAVQVPQGWRMVPEEPTPEMIACGYHSQGEATRFACEEIYRAMLAAATSPPAQAKPDQQLCTFYGVDGFPALVDAMERHIERLQAKLPKDNQAAFNRVREG